MLNMKVVTDMILITNLSNETLQNISNLNTTIFNELEAYNTSVSETWLTWSNDFIQQFNATFEADMANLTTTLNASITRLLIYNESIFVSMAQYNETIYEGLITWSLGFEASFNATIAARKGQLLQRVTYAGTSRDFCKDPDSSGCPLRTYPTLFNFTPQAIDSTILVDIIPIVRISNDPAFSNLAFAGNFSLNPIINKVPFPGMVLTRKSNVGSAQYNADILEMAVPISFNFTAVNTSPQTIGVQWGWLWTQIYPQGTFGISTVNVIVSEYGGLL